MKAKNKWYVDLSWKNVTILIFNFHIHACLATRKNCDWLIPFYEVKITKIIWVQTSFYIKKLTLH